MSFDPCLLLNLSSSLFEDHNYDKESKYRTSISRAYYAAFLVSRTYLEEKGYYFNPDYSVHQEVIDRMKKVNPSVSDLLSDLRKCRNGADYILNKHVEEAITRYSIVSAQKIIDKVHKMECL